jgi:excisionase family DNA binding protein
VAPGLYTVCVGAIVQTDVDYVCEEALHAFALPLHANSLRAFIKHTLYQQWRQGDIDGRMARGLEDFADAQAERHEARATSRRHTAQHRASLTVRDAARQLGISTHTVRRKIKQEKINATQRGRYWQLSPAAVDAEERKRLCRTLRNELILLRARWRLHRLSSLPHEDGVRRAWDARGSGLRSSLRSNKHSGRSSRSLKQRQSFRSCCNRSRIFSTVLGNCWHSLGLMSRRSEGMRKAYS